MSITDLSQKPDSMTKQEIPSSSEIQTGDCVNTESSEEGRTRKQRCFYYFSKLHHELKAQ